MHPAIKEHKSKDKQHYFTVIAPNNKILATSETYKTKQAMRNGIKSLLKNVYDPMIDEGKTRSTPPRSNVAMRLSTLKSYDIQTMADVGQALHDGRLKLGKLN